MISLEEKHIELVKSMVSLGYSPTEIYDEFIERFPVFQGFFRDYYELIDSVYYEDDYYEA